MRTIDTFSDVVLVALFLALLASGFARGERETNTRCEITAAAVR